jgi:hypothetical protein
MFVRVFRSAKQRAGANPARQQRKNKHKRRQRTACNQIVGFRLHLAKTGDRNDKERQNDDS